MDGPAQSSLGGQNIVSPDIHSRRSFFSKVGIFLFVLLVLVTFSELGYYLYSNIYHPGLGNSPVSTSSPAPQPTPISSSNDTFVTLNLGNTTGQIRNQKIKDFFHIIDTQLSQQPTLVTKAQVDYIFTGKVVASTLSNKIFDNISYAYEIDIQEIDGSRIVKCYFTPSELNTTNVVLQSSGTSRSAKLTDIKVGDKIDIEEIDDLIDTTKTIITVTDYGIL